MKRKKLAIICGVCFAWGLVACSGGGPDLEEGMWEITTEVNMPGMPMKIPAMVYRQCLTKDDVVPKQGSANQEICTYSSPKVKGNTVSWSMECKSPGGKTKSETEITYRGASFDGTMTMSMSGAVEMSGENTISGRRIGECQ
ncbi:MAG: DUF3617 family protein [Thermodesulfobacteriota bacterium]